MKLHECIHIFQFYLLEMMLDENPAKRPTTYGIKALPPFMKNKISNGCNMDENSEWHFELPLNRHHSSISSSSGSDSWENVC